MSGGERDSDMGFWGLALTPVGNICSQKLCKDLGDERKHMVATTIICQHAKGSMDTDKLPMSACFGGPIHGCSKALN